jgi:hypothetical protein
VPRHLKEVDVTDIRTLAELTIRAANLADRVEAAGALVAAAVLRGIARDAEDLIIRIAPPKVAGWQRRAGARPRDR